MRLTNFSIILLACLVVYMASNLLNASMANTAYATQKNTREALQNNPRKISGKVTEVITSAGFTYAEVDTGKEKVWAAGPGVTLLKKGDMIAFSTEMPMKNFHSKSLGRDFPLIYFVKRYITDKETSAIVAPHGQIKKQQGTKPSTTTPAGTHGEVKIGDYLREAAKRKNFLISKENR